MNRHQEIQELIAAYEFDLLTPEQRIDVEAHVKECDQCFEDLYEFAPVSNEIRHQRIQMPAMKTSRREFPRYLMAAIIIVAVAGAIWIYRFSMVSHEPVLRGSNAITLQQPAESQQVSAPVSFHWIDRANADEYQISIYDRNGKLIYAARSKSTQYLWSAGKDVHADIYRWKIESFLIDGTLTATSKISEFQLK